ncbi:unnamed protein product [Moneuplotes crassus]|uniref:WD40 repeat-like protein n=1 Tax=Euplotes crassus TaxID=5936 RepID=A0AAD1XIA5_EUPCR|nr:unnamed protein product [Moneuplotes crassus]
MENYAEEVLPVTAALPEMKRGMSERKVRNLTHKFTLEESKQSITSIKFDPGNKYMAAGLCDGSIEIYNLFTGELSYELNKPDEQDMFSTFLEIRYPITSMRWRPQRGLSKTQNMLVTGGADGYVKYWHTTSGKLIHSFKEEGNGIYCIDYNYDGTRLVTGGVDKKIRLYDDAAKDIIHTFQDNSEDYLAHYNRIFCVKFDPIDDRLIYSGGWDNMINVNDTREKGPVSQIIGPYLSGDTLDVYKTQLLVGNYNTENPLEVYDLRKLERLKSIEWKTEEGKEGGKVLGAMFSKSDADAIIACGSVGNEFKIFDSSTENVIASVTGGKKPIYSIDVSESNSLIAFGTSDCLINVLEYNN